MAGMDLRAVRAKGMRMWGRWGPGRLTSACSFATLSPDRPEDRSLPFFIRCTFTGPPGRLRESYAGPGRIGPCLCSFTPLSLDRPAVFAKATPGQEGSVPTLFICCTFAQRRSGAVRLGGCGGAWRARSFFSCASHPHRRSDIAAPCFGRDIRLRASGRSPRVRPLL